MRSMLMFDLPVDTATQRRDYRQFVKYIKKNGFVMFQKSIYVKLSVNSAAIDSLEALIKSHLPRQGLISMITVTEKQFASMCYMLGSFETDVLETDQRYTEL